MPDAFADQFYTTADGPRLHYRDYPAIGDVTGLPVVCLHGLTRNVKDFEDLAPQLAALGRRVIVISQRGRGRSEPDPVPERYQPLTYAIDVIGLLDSIGVDRAVFIGTSMGGLMTMIIAAQDTPRVAAAVINDIGPEIAPEGIARIVANVSSRDPVTRWDEAAARSRAANLAAFPERADDQAFWADFARKTWIEDGDRIRLDYDGEIVEQMGAGDDLPDLWPFWAPFAHMPVLLVRGGITDLITRNTVAEMRRRAPDMQTVEVPDVGHAPFMTEPEAWAAIERFLAGCD